MGNVTSSFSSSSISSINIDNDKGTKVETIIKDDLMTKRFYKLDQFGNWILLKEEKNDVKIDGFNLSSGFKMDHNGMRIGNIIMDHNGMQVGNIKMDHSGITINNEKIITVNINDEENEEENIPENFDMLYKTIKKYEFDNQKIDLVKRYQKYNSCISLDNIHKIVSTLHHDSSKIKIYENVIKCLLKK
jgi:hypothetical protein